ncbi:MAG: hypothetical protein NNA25_01775 [Nitrospira sp.]|nr:hypothetical protein [Nitrospira sp.]
MARRYGSPIAFLFSGFGWLTLASFTGLALLISMILGAPLPPWVRPMHVHASLVGGALQTAMGGFLAALSSPSPRHTTPHLHPAAWLALNGGTAIMVIAFGLRSSEGVGLAGLVVLVTSLWLMRALWIQSQHSPSSQRNRSYFTVCFVTLLASFMGGAVLAFSLVDQFHGYIRLAHIHLGLLGFFLLTTVGALHGLLPDILQTPLASPRLTRLVLIGMPLGVAGLIVGFLNGSVPIELGAGGFLFLTVILYALNQIRTWLASSHRNHAASDHLLIGTFFLLLTIILGILVGINNLSTPPLIPFGTLHLVAYTHMTMIGCIVNTAMGVLSHQIPLLLSTLRVASNKKRSPYQQRLAMIMDRWRAVQISSLNLGTMGLAVVAALTWNVPLSSTSVRVALWMSAGLLLVSFVLFLVKLAMAWGMQPDKPAPVSS